MRKKGDVKPITRSQTVVPPPQPGAHRTSAKPVAVPVDGAAHFHHPLEGEPLLGHDPSVRKRVLKELRAGRTRPALSIDLHGRDRNSAREHLIARVAAARREHIRCVLVIHGRGHRSESGEAVLRRALSGWLEAPPLRDAVLAFAPARPADGGAGATYLLLR